MTTAAKNHDVADLALADAGQARIEWADRHMPVLASIRERFDAREAARRHPARPLPARHHRDREPRPHADRPAAPRSRCAPPTRSRPRTTSPPRWSTRYGAEVYAINGEDDETYYAHINAVCDKHPQITMDDGADVIGVLHGERTDQLSEVIGGTEETTTGVIRLRALEAEGKLGFPIIAVNDAKTKHIFDNRYGTGQSHARRHHPRHQRPDRRQARRRDRLRLVRHGRRDAGQGHGRPRDRLRGRPAAGARGA